MAVCSPWHNQTNSTWSSSSSEIHRPDPQSRTPLRVMALEPSTDMNKFREVVKSSQNIIVIAGAGLSAASGDRPPGLLTHPFILLMNHHPCRYTYFPRRWRTVEEVRGYEPCHSSGVCSESKSSVAILSYEKREVRVAFHRITLRS